MSDVTAKQAALRCAEIARNKTHLCAYAGGMKCTEGNIAAVLEAYADALPDDEGTVRVPVEPTEKMLEAVRRLDAFPYGEDRKKHLDEMAKDTWRAMLAAAKEGA